MRISLSYIGFCFFSVFFPLLGTKIGPRRLVAKNQVVIQGDQLDIIFDGRQNSYHFWSDGIGFAYIHSSGEIRTACIGFCKLNGGLHPDAEVSIQLLRGNIYLQGLRKAEVELGAGEIHVLGLQQLDIRMGKGRIEGELPTESQTSIHLAQGTTTLTVADGSWDIVSLTGTQKIILPPAKSSQYSVLRYYAPHGELLVQSQAKVLIATVDK